jgi:hypothetical protein
MNLREILGSAFWERALRDRLAEPLHLNIASAFVALLGSFRAKVAFDLVDRRRSAVSLLKAADYAKAMGIPKIYAVEFGIAAGAGLVNLAQIGERVTRTTGVQIGLIGLDSGTGMPRPTDYRDYPEEFVEGDFPTPDRALVERNVPPGTRVVYGPLAETARGFLEDLDAPIGFVSLDLAFYSSTVDAMRALEGPAERYLPMTLVYLGAVLMDSANPAVGELLAVEEFNRSHPLRQVHPFTALREKRILKNGAWLNQIHTLHVLDHPRRSGVDPLRRDTWVLANPYAKK